MTLNLGNIHSDGASPCPPNGVWGFEHLRHHQRKRSSLPVSTSIPSSAYLVLGQLWSVSELQVGGTVRFLQHGIPQLLDLPSCRGQAESLVGWMRDINAHNGSLARTVCEIGSYGRISE